MGWFQTQRSKKRSRADSHYRAHKEYARAIISARVAHFNAHYQFSIERIAIKNQRRCWGSCSAKGNLNFNYKIIFLPEALMDYVVVHELCHRAELNHSEAFWNRVAEVLPEYKKLRSHLRRITHVPTHGFPSSVAYIRTYIRN